MMRKSMFPTFDVGVNMPEDTAVPGSFDRMQAEEFREALGFLQWSSVDVAAVATRLGIQLDGRQVRRWYGGRVEVPVSVGVWLRGVIAAARAMPVDRHRMQGGGGDA